MDHASTRGAAPRHVAALRPRLAGLVALTKPRIIELLLVTTVPVMLVASRTVPSLRLVVLTVVGGSLAAGGANAMNMLYDRDIDAVMDRTKARPLVAGVVSPTEALALAISLEAAAFVVLGFEVNLLSAVLALCAAVFYVGVYTVWLKRRSPSNIVIGGAAGAVPVLVGWSAVTGHLSLAAWVMFAVVFFWTPPHFWSLAIRYKDDYTRADVPMLPSVSDPTGVVRQILGYTIVLSACSLLIAPVAHLGWAFFAVTAALDAGFVYHALWLRRDPSPRRAMRLFGYSITYLTVLFVAMGVVALVRHP